MYQLFVQWFVYSAMFQWFIGSYNITDEYIKPDLYQELIEVQLWQFYRQNDCLHPELDKIKMLKLNIVNKLIMFKILLKDIACSFHLTL